MSPWRCVHAAFEELESGKHECEERALGLLREALTKQPCDGDIPTREEAERMAAFLMRAGRTDLALAHECGRGEERSRRQANGAALIEAAVLIEERLVRGCEKEGGE